MCVWGWWFLGKCVGDEWEVCVGWGEVCVGRGGREVCEGGGGRVCARVYVCVIACLSLLYIIYYQYT